MKKLTVVAAAALLGGSLALTPAANAQPAGVNSGTLACQADAAFGFVFGSTRNLNCTFFRANFVEHYVGTIGRFGVDIGFMPGGVIAWNVVSPTMAHGTLAGNYAEQPGELPAVFGGGLPVNTLVGGSTGTVLLQPVRIEGNVGLNAAAAVTAMTLQYHDQLRVSSSE